MSVDDKPVAQGDVKINDKELIKLILDSENELEDLINELSK